MLLNWEELQTQLRAKMQHKGIWRSFGEVQVEDQNEVKIGNKDNTEVIYKEGKSATQTQRLEQPGEPGQSWILTER